MQEPNTASPAEDNAGHAELLNQSDASFVRVLEDVVDVLIDRGVIQFTDLPQAAQSKLMLRRQTRARLQNALQLLPGDSDNRLI